MNENIWQKQEADNGLIDKVCQELSISKSLARVLVGRGIDTKENVTKFFDPTLGYLPDPNIFADMDKAVVRLCTALNNNECIGIFGDYDVDGVTSVTVMWDFLESCGASCTAIIPDRLKDGYGLNRAGVDSLAQNGARVIIIVDCGVSAVEEVQYAVSKGLDVIIVDHHTVPVKLPNALALINPHRKDCESNAKHLCAVGVVFNLCIALRRELRQNGFFASKKEPNLADLLDLVALGTVADIMPLILDNRVFVKYGLKNISTSKRIGMKALLDVADVDSEKISAGTLGFHLGPRINAAGRLEDAMMAVRLFRSNNLNEALEIAQLLDKQNKQRQKLEKNIVEQAVVEIASSQAYKDAMVLVVGNADWHPGVVGIVASRLVEKFGKPTIVIGQKGKGSGRSIPAFHLYNALCQVGDKMLGFGGHAHAVGVHLDFEKLDIFRNALTEYGASVLKSDDLCQTILYDGELDLADVTQKLINNLSIMAPCGRANPEPCFRLNNLILNNVKELKSGHVRGILAGSAISFIAFGLSSKIPLINGPVDMIAIPEINEWMGRKSVQLRVKDIKKSS